MARKRLLLSAVLQKLPLNSDPQWIHDIYGFLLAVFSFTIVYGAFAANTFYGAMNSVPQSQIETGKSFECLETDIHQYHLSTDVEVCTSWPIKPLDVINKINTPTLSIRNSRCRLLGKRVRGSKTSIFQYPHPDWRVWFSFAVSFLSSTYKNK